MKYDILKIIADNQALSVALRKLLERQFDYDDINGNMSNEQLGEAVRSCLVGRDGIRKAFNEISKYKSVPEKPEIKNPAR